MTSRWIRLDTTWDSSKWVAALPAPSQLAWIKLLCYMKAHGDSRSVKSLPLEVASRQWTVTKTAVSRMLESAIADGALIASGGEWVVTGWHRQTDTTQADRARRYRQRKKEDTAPSRSVTAEARDVTPVTPTETETETETKEKEKPLTGVKRKQTLPDDWSPNSTHHDIAIREGVSMSDEVSKFRDHHTSHGKVMRDWDAAFRYWLRNANNFKNPRSVAHEDEGLRDAGRAQEARVRQGRRAMEEIEEADAAGERKNEEIRGFYDGLSDKEQKQIGVEANKRARMIQPNGKLTQMALKGCFAQIVSERIGQKEPPQLESGQEGDR